MAYEFDLNKDKDLNEQPQSMGGAQTVSSGAPVQQKATSSGRFTNIQNYINANKSTNLAGQIGGKIQSEADKAKEDIAKSQQEFGQQAGENRQQYNEGLVQNAIANPAQFAAQEPNVAAFQKQLNASYAGPKDLSNYQQLQGQAQNVQNLGNLGSTQAGRFTLLNNYFGNKNQYNRGQQNLDNLILQANPTQAQQLQQTRQYGGQLVNTLGQTRGQVQQQASQYGQEAADTAAKTQQELGGATTKTQSQIADEFKAAQDAENQRLQTEQDLRSLFTGKGLGEIKDAQGNVTRAAQAAGGNKLNDVNQALSLAQTQGLLSPDEIKDVQALYKRLATPVSQVGQYAVNTGAPGLLGFGGGGKSSTSQVPLAPVVSNLDIGQVLADALSGQSASNLTSGGVASPAERARINALLKLSGKTTGQEIDPNTGQFQRGATAFDLNAAQDRVNKELASLAGVQQLGSIYQDVPLSEKIRRTIAPTGAETAGDVNQELGAITSGGSSAGDRLAAAGQLATTPGRLAAGELVGTGQTLADQLSRPLSSGESLPERALQTAALPVTAPAAILGNTLSNVGGFVGGLSPILTPIAAPISAVGSVASAIGNVFCYVAGTPIRMNNGKYKAVDKIKVGDELFLGGKVIGIGEALEKEIYEYKDTKLSGNHAVFSNGKFERVKNCPGSKRIAKEVKVYPIVSENHLMVTKTHIGADFAETDESQNQTPEERLSALNSDRKLLSNLKLKDRLLFKNANKDIY